jgi:hypothetical protein
MRGSFPTLPLDLTECPLSDLAENHAYSTYDPFIKWRERSLSPELWSSWEFVMMNLVNAPGGQVFWKERSYLFGAEFRDHVENDIMKRKPHPNAKPLGAFSIGSESP